MTCFGIDLGTTYSAIGYYNPDKNEVEIAELNRHDGKTILRSVVYYPENGDPVVGETAVTQAKRYPDRVIIGVKRAMGTDWELPPIDGKTHTPADVSAEILAELKREAEAYFPNVGEVKDVVITVPAYFGNNERDDTKKAAKIAGLNVVRLLEEPSAAALAYSIDMIDEIADRNILVYDLGGGTFDVTLIHCKRKEYSPGNVGLKIINICKEGNRKLGGLDWDNELKKLVVEKCKESDFDPRVDAGDDAHLSEQCEKVKRMFLQLDKAVITADLRGDHEIEVTREEFEDKTASLLAETRQLIEKVLEEAENPPEELKEQLAKQYDIDVDELFPIDRSDIDIMLCGGSTKLLAVERLVHDIMGKNPIKHKNPELLVMMGAAYAAHMIPPSVDVDEFPDDETAEKPKPVPLEERPKVNIMKKGEKTSITLEELSIIVNEIRIKVVKDANHPELGFKAEVLIPGGASVGDIHKGKYQSVLPKQEAIELVLLEGTDPDPDKCKELASFLFKNPIPDREERWTVDVQLKYDNSGHIIGKAVDPETKEEIEIRYER